MKSKLRIVTRKSALALWQARHVRERLLALRPDLQIELVGVQTRGDKILDSPLAKVGGKGLFIKELEQALLSGSADLAVHSIKDMTVDLPDGLTLGAILAREDPRDALLASACTSIDTLPENAHVGTSSLRRQCQLRALRPDLDIRDLRGNVDTRIRRLDEGRFSAIVLAAAGMKRLGLAHRIAAYLDPATMLPAISQGAIGIESRDDDADVLALIAPLDHPETRLCIVAERAVNRRLGGGCQVPIAGYAEIDGEQLALRALVGRPDGAKIIRGEIRGPSASARTLGTTLGEDLLTRGADRILADLAL